MERVDKLIKLGLSVVAVCGIEIGTATSALADSTNDIGTSNKTNTLVIKNKNENHIYSLNSLNESKGYWSFKRTHHLGSTYKGAWVTETVQFFFKGGVFFYPARTGVHQGWLKFTRSGHNVGSARTAYYHKPYSHKKSTKVEATKAIHDSLGWNDPKTKFHYGFK